MLQAPGKVVFQVINLSSFSQDVPGFGFEISMPQETP
jgi:hypothetical protein